MRISILCLLILSLPVFADDNPPLRFSFGGSAFTSFSPDSLQIGTGINFGALARLGENSPLYFGIDAGYIQGIDILAPIAMVVLFPFSLGMNWHFQSATMVPILPTFLARSTGGWVHVYGGLSAGPVIMSVQAYDESGGERVAQPVYFMGFMRGGLDFDVANNVSITFEPVRMGFVQNQWVFNPELALSFGL